MAEWSESEINYIKNNRDLICIDGIARNLGRSYKSVQMKMTHIGITNKQEVVSEENKEIIMKFYGKVPVREISKETGLSEYFVRGLARRMNAPGISDKPGRRAIWNSEMDNMLIMFYGVVDVEYLARHFSTTNAGVYARASVIGITNGK